MFIINSSTKAINIDDWLINDPLITRGLTEEQEDRFLKTKPIIMSLGDNCQPAFYLSLCKIRFMAFPFDWLATPFNDLCDIIKTDFIHLKNPDFFTQAYDPECHAVNPINNYYSKIRFPHAKWDFLFDDLNRRIKRYYKAIEYCTSTKKPLYFIMHSLNFNDSNDIEKKSNEISNLLQDKFPNLNFKLIVMHHSNNLNIPNKNNIIFVYLKYGWDHNSQGEWEQKFKELGLISSNNQNDLPEYNFNETHFNE